MTVEIVAPAKVTLSLRIIGVRSDGYHLIDADMTTVDLCDRVMLSDGEGLELVETDSGLPVPSGGENLVYSRPTHALAKILGLICAEKIIP